jgi:ABC-type polysaccharide/polyol phosphate transport system ATPase subunit
VIGIVGANGAGKSTLLKVIARVLHPTVGRVRVRGVVAPILGLGTGFDAEMTGHENIYLNGAMLGFSRKAMDQKLPRLLAFAGLGEFIDAPLRTYSDGMVARLAFAIATDMNADLLLIDEILTVGDKDFNQKCLDRMNEFKEAGTSILFVSHDLDTVENMCTRVIWLEHGRIRADGKPEVVLPLYRDKAIEIVFSSSQVGDD